MPIISIANIPQIQVRSALLNHIMQITEFKLLVKSRTPDEGAIHFHDLKLSVDFDQEIIDTGNDEELSTLCGIEPIADTIKILAYREQRKSEHALLSKVYKKLCELLRIPYSFIRFCEPPTKEDVCSNKNLFTYLFNIPSTVSFGNLESYLLLLRKKDIYAEMTLGVCTKFYTLKFHTPLENILSILENDNPIHKDFFLSLKPKPTTTAPPTIIHGYPKICLSYTGPTKQSQNHQNKKSIPQKAITHSYPAARPSCSSSLSR